MNWPITGRETVSALAAEWIEMTAGIITSCATLCLRPRGGVD